ncbi:MAG: sugar-binding protein [Candidatus Omnitrophota bacterium]
MGLNFKGNKKVFFIIAIVVIILFIAATSIFFVTEIQEFKEKIFEIVEKPKGELLKPILIDDFNKGFTSGLFYERINSLGGYQGTWAKRPSYSLINKSSEDRIGEKGKALVIEFKKEAGWCGWYTLLNGLDASRYNTLSFWVKGAEGGEKFDIGIADSEMQELEIDAVYIGSINAFLRKGVTKRWQEVKIPLSRIAGEVNFSSLGSVVFWFKYAGAGKIYVDDMMFRDDPEIARIERYNTPKARYARRHPRAMWVWKTDPIINLIAREKLFEFCRTAAIKTIYLYLGDLPEDTEKLSQFLTEAHNKKILVEALTGNPVWCLSENHQLTLNWIKSFLEYNKFRISRERIDGISLDVEPYLTSEWVQDRESVKRQYIEMLRKCRQLIDSYEQDFRFGVAIPIFFDKEEDGLFEQRTLELVDYCALMDYYDDAPNLIKNAKNHIALAKKAGKKMVVGVETQDLISMHQGLRRNTFFEEGWEAMEKALLKLIKKYKNSPAFEGVAIHCYESYRLLPKGRNVPTKERPKDVRSFASIGRRGRIIIDGRLDDWDTSLPFLLDKKEDIVFGSGGWKGKEDFSVEVFSQWDAENLYFAFKIKDDKLVQEKSEGDMWEGDHVELWLDVDLLGDYNEAINSSDDFQFGFSPGNFSTLPAEVYIWTPPLEDMNYKDYIAIGSAKVDNGYIIEAKIPKGVLFSKLNEDRKVEAEPLNELPKRFSKGMKMGIGIDPSECDGLNEPQKLMMSSAKERIWGDPTTFIILELK